MRIHNPAHFFAFLRASSDAAVNMLYDQVAPDMQSTFAGSCFLSNFFG